MTNGYNSTYTQNPFYGFGNASYPGGYVGKTQYNYYAVNFQELVKYNKSFGKHNVSVLAGHENYVHNYDYITGSRKNMFSYFGNHELSGATTMIDNGSYSSKYKTEGWIFVPFTIGMANTSVRFLTVVTPLRASIPSTVGVTSTHSVALG